MATRRLIWSISVCISYWCSEIQFADGIFGFHLWVLLLSPCIGWWSGESWDFRCRTRHLHSSNTWRRNCEYIHLRQKFRYQPRTSHSPNCKFMGLCFSNCFSGKFLFNNQLPYFQLNNEHLIFYFLALLFLLFFPWGGNLPWFSLYVSVESLNLKMRNIYRYVDR